MRRQEREHPAPATERLERWTDLEDMIVCLQELGWTLEKLVQIDEAGEPVRAVIRLRHDPPSALEGLL